MNHPLNLLIGLGGAAAIGYFLVQNFQPETAPADGVPPAGSSLRGLAANAGFSGADLDTAVAVAVAESGGNPRAYNPETAAGAPQGKGSYGLWQIFLYRHPEFEGWDLFDPVSNAAAAFNTGSKRFHPSNSGCR